MTSWRGRLAGCCVAATTPLLACLTIVPAMGHANQGNVQISHSIVRSTQGAYALFNVRGAHGYKISVVGSAKGVALIASKEHSAAIYVGDIQRM